MMQNNQNNLAAPSLDLFGDPIEPPRKNALARRFGVPPFSVLNAREGWWQDRKTWWLSLGIRGEVGRNGGLVGVSAFSDAWQKAHPECKSGQGVPATGTSIFDPVLCELVYRWFCPSSGQVIDPFAGGSVRGIVAHALGLRYWGCELREEQVEANREQAVAMCLDGPPTWLCDDSRLAIHEAPQADLLFTCPPYGNLEVYSDDPRDISTMTYNAFMKAFREIIWGGCKRLRDNRFAAIVVSEFRDKWGAYRNFVGDTVETFRQAGLAYYNEAVLVTPAGSLPIRITKQFEGGRKLGKTHQNVLVFVKGDNKIASQKCSGGE